MPPKQFTWDIVPNYTNDAWNKVMSGQTPVTGQTSITGQTFEPRVDKAAVPLALLAEEVAPYVIPAIATAGYYLSSPENFASIGRDLGDWIGNLKHDMLYGPTPGTITYNFSNPIAQAWKRMLGPTTTSAPIVLSPNEVYTRPVEVNDVIQPIKIGPWDINIARSKKPTTSETSTTTTSKPPEDKKSESKGKSGKKSKETKPEPPEDDKNFLEKKWEYIKEHPWKTLGIEQGIGTGIDAAINTAGKIKYGDNKYNAEWNITHYGTPAGLLSIPIEAGADAIFNRQQEETSTESKDATTNKTKEVETPKKEKPLTLRELLQQPDNEQDSIQ